MTYLNTSSFTLYLLPFVAALSRQKKEGRGRESSSAAFRRVGEFWVKLGFHLPSGSLWHSRREQGYTGIRCEEDEERSAASDGSEPDRHRTEVQRATIPPPSIEQPLASRREAEHAPPLDLHETALLALHFMLVWFMANYCLNVSLELTSVASATTLSSASGFFTLALGSVVGVERFSLAKVGAVTMSFFGVLTVTRADAKATHDLFGAPVPGGGRHTPAAPLAGDLLALASAGFYAVYVILLKRRIGHEARISMPLFFGFVGLFNILAMWPVGLLLHCTGAETLSLPHGHAIWAGVVLNMAITVLSDMAYLLAMLKSSPLVVTVGLSLTIPLAILGDLLRDAHSGGLQSYVGSALVLLSFVAVALADRSMAQRPA